MCDAAEHDHEGPYIEFIYHDAICKIRLCGTADDDEIDADIAEAVIGGWEDAIIDAAERGIEIDPRDIPHAHIAFKTTPKLLMRIVPTFDAQFLAWAQRDVVAGQYAYRLWNLIRHEVKEMCETAFDKLPKDQQEALRQAASQRN